MKLEFDIDGVVRRTDKRGKMVERGMDSEIRFTTG